VDQKVALGHGDLAVQPVRVADAHDALDGRLARRPQNGISKSSSTTVLT
jgi:hypothetical protein